LNERQKPEPKTKFVVQGEKKVSEIDQIVMKNFNDFILSCTVLPACKYRVIFKKVSFGIFRTILVTGEEKNFTIKSEHKGLSLSKFS